MKILEDPLELFETGLEIPLPKPNLGQGRHRHLDEEMTDRELFHGGLERGHERNFGAFEISVLEMSEAEGEGGLNPVAGRFVRIPLTCGFFENLERFIETPEVT